MVIRRRLDLSEPGLVFVTTAVHNWTRLFSVDGYGTAVLAKFAETLTFFHATCHGWVLMPSHFHAIIALDDLTRLSAFMQAFKVLSSRRIHGLADPATLSELMVNGRFSLWRPRFDDFVLRNEEQFRSKLNYIHQNPVKAGLVSREVDWNWSSASDWVGGSTGLIPVETDLGCIFRR